MDEMLGNIKLRPVILVVLGPHRSGTSALTGVLSRLGANLPKHLMPENDGNSKGYFESSRVKSFNDRLLSKAGSSWHDILPLDLASVPEQVQEGFLEEAVELLKTEFDNARTPILKDPRICRLVDFWREAFDRFGYRPIYIHTHRNPLEMARSLAARHPISVEIGLLIWLRHVLDAEATTRNEPRAFTNYRALLENWRVQVSNIEAATGFGFHHNTLAIQEIESFLSEDLHHQIHQPEDVRQSTQVADLVHEAFEIFEGWTNGISDPADHHRLDRLRARLDSLVGAFAPFVQVLERDNAKRKLLEARLEGLERDCVQGEAERSRLAAELDRLREDGARRDADHMAHLSELERELRQRSLEAEQSFDSIRQLTGTVEALQTENLRLTEENGAEQQRFEDGIRSRDDAVRALKANVEERFSEIARISEMMLEASRQLDKERARRTELERDCVQGEAERSRLAAELDRLREDGARRDADHMAHLSELERELRQRSLEAEQSFDSIRQLTGTVEALQTENLRLTEENGAEQQRFEDGIRSRDDAVRALKANAEERFSEIARISKMMLEASRQLDKERARRTELERDFVQGEAERSRLAAELDRLRKEAGDMRAWVDALLASTSWRITGPLRRLVTLIRR